MVNIPYPGEPTGGCGIVWRVWPLEDYGHCIVFSASDVGDHSCGRHDLSHSSSPQKADLIWHFALIGLRRSATDRICYNLHSARYLVVARAQDDTGDCFDDVGLHNSHVHFAIARSCGLLSETGQEA